MRTLPVILILVAITGCQSKTYKPADWKELPKNDSIQVDGLTAEGTDLDSARLDQFGELTDWTNPGFALVVRYGTTSDSIRWFVNAPKPNSIPIPRHNAAVAVWHDASHAIGNYFAIAISYDLAAASWHNATPARWMVDISI